MTGAGNGLLGGLGSVCPDTKAVRDYVHEPGHMHLGIVGAYCDGCLKIPAGHLFVFWEIFIGPNCPSGCPHSSGVTDI